jgi:hypothetical protein
LLRSPEEMLEFLVTSREERRRGTGSYRDWHLELLRWLHIKAEGELI